LGAALPSGRADRYDAFARAAPTALLALVLAACTVPAPPETADERPPVDLRRSGWVSDRTGAAVPLALCARSAGLARAIGLPPALLRLPAACGAANRL
jgi:hypothetical protein